MILRMEAHLFKATDPRLATMRHVARCSEIVEDLLNAHDTPIIDDIGKSKEEDEKARELTRKHEGNNCELV